MVPISISDSMKTNVPEIDAQHKELIDRINAVISMGVDAFTIEETQKTVEFLGEYIIKHFSYEEKMQEKCGYPDLEIHKKLHKQFIFNFELMKKELVENGPTYAFAQTLNNSIVGWIIRHIKTVDVDFGKFYNENVK